jgi:TRAP-type C4-dicarboxylate transport system substrate-binding protein
MTIRIRSMLFALLASVIALSLGAIGTPAHAEATKWKFANPWPNAHPATKKLNEMFDEINERAKGKLEIEMMFLSAVGYKQGDLLRVLKQNIASMSLFVPYYVSRDAPLLANVIPAGGLIDAEQNLAIAQAQRDYAARILERDWGMVLATRFFNLGGRDLIIVSKDPVNTLDGLKGKKLRHFDKTAIQAMTTLGISAQTLPQSELYLALQTGVVDAAVHGLTNAKSQSLNEVACCFSDFTPFPGQGAPYGFITRKEDWAALPADVREVITDVAEKQWAEGVAGWRAGIASAEAKKVLIERGMKDLGPFSKADRETLQQTVFKVWRAQCEKLGPEAVQLYDNVFEAMGR